MLRAVLLLCVILGGCATKTTDSSFKPRGDGTYEYVAFAGKPMPLDSPKAEATRMAWLEEYLADNGLCPNGYEIQGREPVDYRVWYIVACKP